MSVTTENAPVQGQTTLQENRAGEGVYASLFEKINLTPASRLGDINDFLDDAALSEALQRRNVSPRRCRCLWNASASPASGWKSSTKR